MIWILLHEITGFLQNGWCSVLKKKMRSLLEKLVPCLMAITLLSVVAADADSAMAAVLPPETLAPEEEAAPSELAPEPESNRHPENPLKESAKPEAYEEKRRKHEKTTIYIILAVVLLLCAYWWTSGKLHHRIPE